MSYVLFLSSAAAYSPLFLVDWQNNKFAPGKGLLGRSRTCPWTHAGSQKMGITQPLRYKYMRASLSSHRFSKHKIMFPNVPFHSASKQRPTPREGKYRWLRRPKKAAKNSAFTSYKRFPFPPISRLKANECFGPMHFRGAVTPLARAKKLVQWLKSLGLLMIK